MNSLSHSENRVQNGILHAENEAQSGTFHVGNEYQNDYQNGVQNGFQNSLKMRIHLQNEFAFLYYFDALKFQGRSYGIHKKILSEEMHEGKIT